VTQLVTNQTYQPDYQQAMCYIAAHTSPTPKPNDDMTMPASEERIVRLRVEGEVERRNRGEKERAVT
jgi:hypothetical protein